RSMAIAKESLPPPGWGLEGSAASLLGAFPRGQLSEIVGLRSAGGSSLVTSLLAHATAAGALVALVDGSDAFDPAGAAAAGAALRSRAWGAAGPRPRAPRPRGRAAGALRWLRLGGARSLRGSNRAGGAAPAGPGRRDGDSAPARRARPPPPPAL